MSEYGPDGKLRNLFNPKIERMDKCIPLFIRGWTNAQISREIGVSKNTVAKYRTDPYVVEALSKINQAHVLAVADARDQKTEDLRKAIKSVSELQVFWSEQMEDPDVPHAIRMKASELLAKAQGQFTDSIKVEQAVQKDLEDALARVAKLAPVIGRKTLLLVMRALAGERVHVLERVQNEEPELVLEATFEEDPN